MYWLWTWNCPLPVSVASHYYCFVFFSVLSFLFHVVLMSLDGSSNFCFHTCQKWLAVARGWWRTWNLSDQIYISLKSHKFSTREFAEVVFTLLFKSTWDMKLQKNKLSKNTNLTWYWLHYPLIGISLLVKAASCFWLVCPHLYFYCSLYSFCWCHY